MLWLRRLFTRQGNAAPAAPVEQAPLVYVPRGLQKGFHEGETLPWKGIHFKVGRVEPEAIVLLPISMTAARAKARREALNGQ